MTMIKVIEALPLGGTTKRMLWGWLKSGSIKVSELNELQDEVDRLRMADATEAERREHITVIRDRVNEIYESLMRCY